ncbi:MAG TPA: polysaccharide deacetylase family protein [Methylibium sp.]|uniref:polysaccharide deacetylase family protein n=1 Tax=Methylibium sp. TaxID=2067992 RepID=UPI002DBA1E97|nr:polysaccharide deacetylase family protein [Methylibium sp.]HEU4458407.1 polysaccharide deacetylase family protein [Methylibium sp.]
MQFTLGKPNPWPVPPLIQASVGLHVGAAALALAAPQAAAWALGGVVLNHAALTAAGLWPRSDWLGPNLTRLPDDAARRGCVAITIDDGPDPAVTPRVLDALDAEGLVASFFCIAERAAAHKPLVREILARGHAVENHSDAHRHHFSLLGPRGFAREIGRAQQVLADITGRAPIAFRAPAGLRNPFLDPVLHRLGLHLVSWTRRGFDTRERDARRVLARLTRGLAAGDILLLHDGHAARSPAGVPVLLDVLPALAARLREAGLHSVALPAAIAPRRAGAGA